MSTPNETDTISVSRKALRATLSGAMRQPLHVSLSDALTQTDEIIETLIVTEAEKPSKNAGSKPAEFVMSYKDARRLASQLGISLDGLNADDYGMCNHRFERFVRPVEAAIALGIVSASNPSLDLRERALCAYVSVKYGIKNVHPEVAMDTFKDDLVVIDAVLEAVKGPK